MYLIWCSACQLRTCYLLDVSLAVGPSGEGKVANNTLERSVAGVGTDMPDQRTFVRTRVDAQITLVRRQAQVGADVNCEDKIQNVILKHANYTTKFLQETIIFSLRLNNENF